MKVLALVFLMAAVINAGEISPSLKKALAEGRTMDVMIQLPSLQDIFDSPSVMEVENVETRTATMISMLKERTAASRQPFVQILSALGLGNQKSITKPLWISNRFEVKNADLELVTILARVPGDFLIREPKTASIIGPVETKPAKKPQQGELQWGVAKIETEKAWMYTNGTGSIVAIIDTGVHLGHDALNGGYAGAWHDPYYNKPTPDDTQSHGSHALGSAIGRAGGIGVAPGAGWIACRGLDNQGSGSEANLIDCAQWVLTADPKPNVCTNSWGGGSEDDWYDESMRAWIVAGIMPIFALGNSGSSCRSANSPGDSRYAIGVGATNTMDAVSYFSSRGPTLYFLKPEVSAPGEDIISAGNSGTDTYTSKSGTSMATPHVAGAVALLLSLEPKLTFLEVRERLEMTGDHPTVTDADLSCGDQEWPNNAFGYGRINAGKLVGGASEKIYF